MWLTRDFLKNFENFQNAKKYFFRNVELTLLIPLSDENTEMRLSYLPYNLEIEKGGPVLVAFTKFGENPC